MCLDKISDTRFNNSNIRWKVVLKYKNNKNYFAPFRFDEYKRNNWNENSPKTIPLHESKNGFHVLISRSDARRLAQIRRRQYGDFSSLTFIVKKN